MLLRHHLPALRALLIMALLAASLGFAPVAKVQANDAAEHHHAHVEHGDQQKGHGDAQHHGGEHAVAHVCLGCAVVGHVTMIDVAAAPAGVPDMPTDQASMQSFQSNPIPPPPRLS